MRRLILIACSTAYLIGCGNSTKADNSEHENDTISIISITPSSGDTLFGNDTIVIEFSKNVYHDTSVHAFTTSFGSEATAASGVIVSNEGVNNWMQLTSEYRESEKKLYLFTPSFNPMPRIMGYGISTVQIQLNPHNFHGATGEFIRFPTSNNDGNFIISFEYEGANE